MRFKVVPMTISGILFGLWIGSVLEEMGRVLPCATHTVNWGTILTMALAFIIPWELGFNSRENIDRY